MITKLMSTILFLFILLPLHAQAVQQEFQSASYDEAAKAANYLRFNMASTKMGLLTTHFTGYVKNFLVRGEFNEKEVRSGAQIEFKVADLDTDVSGRNEKMWNKCLDEKNNPLIRVTLNEAVAFNKESAPIKATLQLRGQEKPISVFVKASLSESGITVDLSSELSIKELGIPDPSILVASVKDKIEIKGHFTAKKN